MINLLLSLQTMFSLHFYDVLRQKIIRKPAFFKLPRRSAESKGLAPLTAGNPRRGGALNGLAPAALKPFRAASFSRTTF